MMLTLTMMSDNDIASKFKAAIRIRFVFGRIIILVICIWSNSHDPIFDTAIKFVYYNPITVAYLSSHLICYRYY